jgi:hypothetical protein
LRSAISISRHRSAAGGLLLFALCSCAPRADDAAVCAAHRQAASNLEVIADGSVTGLLGTREGRSGEHEGFLLRLKSGCALQVRVETNVGITGPIPLHDGEYVIVKGEYESDPSGPVIHWTHRAFRSRHASGYVQAAGHLYW